MRGWGNAKTPLNYREVEQRGRNREEAITYSLDVNNVGREVKQKKKKNPASPDG
jgi:hypothetical protein